MVQKDEEEEEEEEFLYLSSFERDMHCCLSERGGREDEPRCRHFHRFKNHFNRALGWQFPPGYQNPFLSSIYHFAILLTNNAI
jgi:hypothetical protein